ncbi:MAG: hypothetical protein K2P58_11550 [Hyphomonadaceae bacterium]|nr:hypothetical protein [Hyphomonadaceae bacterium]
MAEGPRPAAFASDDWMLERQLRAELEAEAWRRLRAELAAGSPAPAAPAAPAEVKPRFDFHAAGSAVLKAVIRFWLAAAGSYLAWLCAVDARLGEFETWLALAAGFVGTLSLSLLPGARGFVLMLAEGLRWVIVGAALVGVAWLLLQSQSPT